jgi:hypothetical protein
MRVSALAESTQVLYWRALQMNDSSTPFDEFEHSERSVQEVRHGLFWYWTRVALQGISFGSLWIALLTAASIR